jgi:hypothetical protein
MTSKKYVIAPGFVHSTFDRQRHYIGAEKLMQLYGVKPEECEIYEPSPRWTNSHFRIAAAKCKGKTRLGPRNDGDYSLPDSGDSA